MFHIEKHLSHMLNNEQTTTTHATDALLAEIRAVNLDKLALERLGRHVLAEITADLKSGIRMQKAVLAAMRGNRHE